MRFTHIFRSSKRCFSCVITLIVLSVLSASCKKHDSDLRQQIVGIWAQKENSFVVTLDQHGSFHSQCGTSNSIKQIDYYGTWTVKSGSLQMAITNTSARGTTNFEAVGNIDIYRIVQADASALELEFNGQNLFYQRK